MLHSEVQRHQIVTTAGGIGHRELHLREQTQIAHLPFGPAWGCQSHRRPSWVAPWDPTSVGINLYLKSIAIISLHVNK